MQRKARTYLSMVTVQMFVTGCMLRIIALQFWKVLKRGRVGDTYCIGGSSERTNLQVIDAICGQLDKAHPEGAPHENLKTFVKDRPGHDRRYAIDCTKIEKELGWSAKYGFEEGVAKTVDWYLSNLAWCENVTSGKYQRERLGAS